MAKVTQVDKKITISGWDGTRFQILTHCFLRNIRIADGELECLALLAQCGTTELNPFCEHAASTTQEGLPAIKNEDGTWKDKTVYASAQAVRNSISRLEGKGLVIKNGRNKKTICLHPEVTAVAKGNVFLNFQIMAIATAES